MWERWELKDRAKKNLGVYYGQALLICFLQSVMAYGVSIIVSMILQFVFAFLIVGIGATSSFASADDFTTVLPIITSFLLIYIVFITVFLLIYFLFTNPLIVGKNRYFMIRRQQEVGIGVLFSAFNRTHFWNIVKIQFLQGFFIFLWALLCYVPGIVKAYEYRMIPYILSENAQIDSKKAFQLSKEMMTGNKLKLFVLDLSFLGWMILGALLCGVGVIFVMPYYEATYAEFYTVVRQGRDYYELPGYSN